MSNGLSQVIVKCPSVVLFVRMFNCKLFKCLSFVKCFCLSVNVLCHSLQIYENYLCAVSRVKNIHWSSWCSGIKYCAKCSEESRHFYSKPLKRESQVSLVQVSIQFSIGRFSP